MKIGVIGQGCIDEIISQNGETKSQSLGGIFYSYAALERLCRESQEEVVIIPFGFRSTPDKALLQPFFDQLTHFDLSRLISTPELTNRVQLVYQTDSDRTEHCPAILPTLRTEDLRKEDFTDLDALFVNMISGYDIALEAMEQVASWSTELGFTIHLDIHALALGPLSEGSERFGHVRKAQGLKDWQRWISAAQTVQLNELEADHIGEPDYAGQAALIEEINSLVGQSKTSLTKAIILTQAARGASIFELRNSMAVNTPAPQTQVVDSTGSGDVFGSAFTFQYLRTHSFEAATQLAVAMATWNTQLHSIEEIISSPTGV